MPASATFAPSYELRLEEIEGCVRELEARRWEPRHWAARFSVRTSAMHIRAMTAK
jgi:hypothetical protein